jgi:hypothetical protein
VAVSINIQARPTPQMWQSEAAAPAPPGEDGVITDEFGNPLTDEFGNPLTADFPTA